jgi:hypothetical protein
MCWGFLPLWEVYSSPRSVSLTSPLLLGLLNIVYIEYRRSVIHTSIFWAGEAALHLQSYGDTL